MMGIFFTDEFAERCAGIAAVDDTYAAGCGIRSAENGIDRNPTLVCIFAVKIDFDDRSVHDYLRMKGENRLEFEMLAGFYGRHEPRRVSEHMFRIWRLGSDHGNDSCAGMCKGEKEAYADFGCPDAAQPEGKESCGADYRQ